MRLTKRGYIVVALASALAFVGIGYVESAGTYCSEMHAAHVASPNDYEIVKRAWDNGCSFTDESGNHLYQWNPQETN